jgi:Chaperone of endosialidase
VQALFNNTTGGFNTADGELALVNNTIGEANTATGRSGLGANTTGNNNTADGLDALFNNTTGNDNTAVGNIALFGNTSGSSNVALGSEAGENATTGSHNVYIGAGMLGVAAESNACYIASIFGQTSASGIPVVINANSKLGTATSSKRFKEDIKPMDKASEALLALKPVTFHYKKEIDPTRTSQFGLVAEDVEKVNPDLVVHDKQGKAYSVRYDQVNAMLLNEFLKAYCKLEEHDRTSHEQEAMIAELNTEIASLTATVKNQAAEIQKVKAEVQTSKAAPQVVMTKR